MPHNLRRSYGDGVRLVCFLAEAVAGLDGSIVGALGLVPSIAPTSRIP